MLFVYTPIHRHLENLKTSLRLQLYTTTTQQLRSLLLNFNGKKKMGVIKPWAYKNQKKKRTYLYAQTQAKQYIREMAELSKRIQAAHSHHGFSSHHHNHNQQHQQHIVERYKEISSSVDDSSNIPKPLSVV